MIKELLFNFEKELTFLSDAGTGDSTYQMAGQQGVAQMQSCHIKASETSFRAILLSEYIKNFHKRAFVITPSGEYAEKLAHELTWLLGSGAGVKVFPSWEIMPYNGIFPTVEIQAERITVISEHVCYKNNEVIIASAKALMPRLPARDTIESFSLIIKTGGNYSLGEISERLIKLGYNRQTTATSIGEFSIRGGILDIYPPNTDYPVRIEMFSNTAESIRYYMSIDQRSFEKIDDIYIPPVTEFLEQTINNKVTSPEEIQYKESSTIFDYINVDSDIIIINPEEVDNTIERYTEDIHKYHRQATEEQRRVNDADAMFVTLNELNDAIKKHKVITISASGSAHAPMIDTDKALPLEDIELLSQSGENKLYAAYEYIKHLTRKHTLNVLVMNDREHVEHIRQLLEKDDIRVNIIDEAYPECLSRLKPGINIIYGLITAGFIYNDIPFASEWDLFKRKLRKNRKHIYHGEPLNLDELKFGTYIVHREYGIGRLKGITVMEVESQKNELIEIEYKDEAKLYLPVERANMLSQYIPSSDIVPVLDRLGGNGFLNRIKKIKNRLYEIANEFMNNQAIREVKGGYSFSAPDTIFHAFEDDFPYEETADQKRAIEEVIDDMLSSKAMDRLICGDSGYGKTEIAMRAAFKAVMDNKQVALLAPTTILSEQHYRVFLERFKKYPVKIELLNRFKNPAQKKKIINELAKGTIDILIGTHAILKGSVRFKSLGLIIIDEEHKFGVDHKEALKKFNPSADILVITATPIPRTLKMALTGIKDISIITTPPSDRKMSQYYIMKYDEYSIRNIIIKELERKGQVFVINREIRGLEQLADRIKNIVPEASIAVAHGQLPSKRLEEIMRQFILKDINVLVSTAIVESGIDIPSANTIIINDADMFGTSELYQLKGRVGRSDQTGYVYFILPLKRSVSQQAISRLKLVASSSEMSSGFKLAMHDMEMRGAGNIVGKAQSGQIDAIGLEFYSELMKEAISSIKGEDIEEEIEPKINFPVPAYIPDSYINDPELRLMFYRRLSGSDEKTLYDIIDEIKDRFGTIPSELEMLLKIIRIKLLMKKIKATKLDRLVNNFRLTFSQSTPIKVEHIVKLVNERIMSVLEQKHTQILFEPINTKGIGGVLKILEFLSSKVEQ